MAAGIKVVGFDSSPAVGAYNVFVNQVDFSGVGVNLADWACELAPSCTGDIAILSAAATATNQNAWIDLMKTTLATDAKYKGLKLVDTVYGDDDATKSTTQAQGLLTKYPNLKVIVAPTTVGILAAAQVVKEANKSDTRQGDRPRLPERHEAVRQGRHVAGLRAVERPGPRLPLLAGRREARQRRDHGQRGRDLHGHGPQRRQAVHDRQGQHRHPRAGLPVRLDERRRLQLLGRCRVRRDADRGPGRHRLRGPRFQTESEMERVGFTMRLLPGAEAEYRRRHAAVWPEMLDALRAAGARDYSIFLRGDGPVRLSRGRRLRTRSGPRWRRRDVNDRWQAEMAALIDPLTDPGDRLPPAARGDLPPRLTDQPATRSASQRSLTRSWKPWPPSCSLYGYSRISFGPP